MSGSSPHAFKCPACGSLAADYAKPHCDKAKEWAKSCRWFDCGHCRATWDSSRGTWYRLKED